MEKKLAKITSVQFGLVGYQNCQFGLSLTFEGKGWGCGTTETSGWDAASMKCDEHCKWTEADRSKGHDELCRKISLLLKQAKVQDVAELLNTPVECELESSFGKLKSWRILEEVL